MGSNVYVKCGEVRDILSGATTTATGVAMYKDSPYSTFQANVAGSGAVSATVLIEGSNDGTLWSKTALATITLSATTSDTDGAFVTSTYKFVRARISAISGTGATVKVTMGT